MIYSEAAYFDGHHVAHLAARDEHLRLERKRRVANEQMRRSRPRLRLV